MKALSSALPCPFVFAILLSVAPLIAATDSIPAFPGAEGWGAYTPGGRGGEVIHVTNLNTSGPGSLQAVCSESGPRIVVFDTSGIINGPVTIEHGNITIMGQTAPGAGITIRGKFSAESTDSSRLSDIVVRFIRVRPVQLAEGDGSDQDAVQFNMVDRTVLDHISVAWSTDENIGFYQARHSTVQWCTIEEACVEGHVKGAHNYGLLCGPEGGPITVHHNLFANNSRRHPAIANGPSDIRNNVVYNFRDGFLHDNKPNRLGFNIVGNYYKRGPSSQEIFPFCFADTALYYLRENYVDGIGLVSDPWSLTHLDRGFAHYAPLGERSLTEFNTPPVATDGPRDAYHAVLERAGCFPRDIVTRRTIAEVRTRTGAWGKHEPAELLEGLIEKSLSLDSDHDGISEHRWGASQRVRPVGRFGF